MPGSRVELTLFTGLQGSRSQECEHGRSGPAPHLPHSDMGEKEGLLFPLPLIVCDRWESWRCSSPIAALRGAGPAPHLGGIVELTLLAGLWFSLS